MPMPIHDETPQVPLDHVLPYFRAAMPGVGGVVLASARGEALAHDLRAWGEAEGVASRAVSLHHDACGCAPLADARHGASIFVPHGGGVVLVVFLAAAAARAPPARVPVAA